MLARFVNDIGVGRLVMVWVFSWALFPSTNASSGDVITWEEQRRARSTQDEEMRQSFERILEKRRDQLIASLPPLQRRQLEGIEVRVDNHNDDYMFIFESKPLIDSNGNRHRKLSTTVETIVTIYKVAGAIALANLDPNVGENWSDEYLLYMRKTPNGVPIVGPLQASGILTADGVIRPGVSHEMLADWKKETAQISECMIMFLVAHEIGHFANWITDRQTNESDRDFEKRKKASETEADRFGLSMLLDIERSTASLAPKDRPQFYARGAPMVFLWWVWSMEGSRHPISAETHPLDHERALTTADLIFSNIDSFGLTPKEREQLIKATTELRDEMANIKKQGQKFFDDLDLKAADITIATLSRYH